ncbi:hypothetical protein Tco_1038469 [Tanacetum coccineum]
MIDQDVTAALAARDANRSMNGDDSHNSGMGARRTERVTRKCTYTDFLKCQPLNFKGTKGVAGLSQWFERMKSVFHISNCTFENQVKFATCTLHSVSLTWWNTHVKTVGHDATYESYKIERYVGGLPNMIHRSVVASNPKTMQEAIEMATEMMDKKICTFAERQAKNKRKLDNNNQAQQPPRSKEGPCHAESRQSAIKLARQKSYANERRKPLEFQVDDRVMLKVMEKVGSVAYKLELPQELSSVHHTFHVSNLKKCYTDEPLSVTFNGFHIEDKLYFIEESKG